jgi:hypothetical protein
MGSSLFAIALLLAAPSGAKPPSPVSLTVAARFLPERSGDGAPQLRFVFRFKNVSDKPLYLSWYGYPIAYRHVGPASRFWIRDAPRRPHKRSPPRLEDFFVVPPGQSVRKSEEEWVGSFVVSTRDGQPKEYRLRHPGKVSLTLCYSPEDLDPEDMKRLLPADAIPFVETICAAKLSIDIPALAKHP